MTIKQAWFRHPHRWLLRLLCFGAIGTELWEILAPEHLRIGLRDYAPLVILALLSLFVMAFLEQDGPGRNRLAELGIRNIYRTRLEEGQIASYVSLLETAKTELFIVGITLKDLSREQGHYLRRSAASGCAIDLLMLHPKFRANKDPILDPVAHAERHDLTHAFGDAINKIRMLAEFVTTTHGALTVRFYETSPSLSLTVKDGASPHGQMHIEIVPHQIPEHSFRPILDLIKDGEEEIFSDIYNRYRHLWRDSHTYLKADGSGIRVDEALDRQLSKWLAIEPNWKSKGAAAGSSDGSGRTP